MSIKRILLILPIIFIPYVNLGALLLILFSTENDVCRFIINNMFLGNGLLVILFAFIYIVFAAALCVTFVILGFVKKWEPLLIVKVAIAVKIIQIPAYIVIFVLGVLLAITLFTMPMAILLLISNMITLILTGILVIMSVVLAMKKYKLEVSNVVLYIVLQFAFCADVVMAVMWHAKLKRMIAA